MLTGVLIVPWLDGFAKLLGQTLPVLEVAWARFAVQLMLILPFAWFRLGRNMLKLGQWKLQIIRGVLLVLASTLFFASLRTMEIADAIAVIFIHPLLTMVIAPILLGEKVGLQRWLPALVGFSGALMEVAEMDKFTTSFWPILAFQRKTCETSNRLQCGITTRFHKFAVFSAVLS